VTDSDVQSVDDTIILQSADYTIILMMPRITQHFTIHIATMSIGKHSDAD